jgi:hypothetical protein
VNDQEIRDVAGSLLVKEGLGKIRVPGRGLNLFYLRELAHDGVYHLWGGKRVLETWDAKSGKLTLELHGPLGLEETVLIGVGRRQVEEVRVNGKQRLFFFDSAQRVVHGKIVFDADPIRIEVIGPSTGEGKLPEKPVESMEIPAR